MKISNTYLQSIIDGEIGVIDSTQAVAVARELLAARKAIKKTRVFTLEPNPMYIIDAHHEAWNALEAYDAARKAAE